MDIKYSKVYKIDTKLDKYSEEKFANSDNFDTYISELINSIEKNDGDREYNFEDTLSTTKNHLDKLINCPNKELISKECDALAARLLQVEKDTQDKIKQLNIEIQKGILLIAVIAKKPTEYRIIISKADYVDFLKEISGEKTSGLPIKKRIFKSFIADCYIENNIVNYANIKTYDSNTETATYWWKTFLELREIRSDRDNSKKAFVAIKNNIISPIKKDSKRDFITLWNMTLGYFKSTGQFDVKHFAESVIGTYNPESDTVKIDDIKNKILKAPAKYKFDNKFNKDISAIKDKFKIEVKLTEEINLVFNNQVQDLDKTISAEIVDGKKYIKILTDEGYEYFRSGLNNGK